MKGILIYCSLNIPSRNIFLNIAAIFIEPYLAYSNTYGKLGYCPFMSTSLSNVITTSLVV